MSGTEDVNGDGIGDFLIADPADSSFDGGAGCVRVFSGSDCALLRIPYGNKDDALGRALCGLGDVDGNSE